MSRIVKVAAIVNHHLASLNLMDSLPSISDAPNWSELPLDLLHLVFERLGFADFQRAKCVCSSWHSTSRQSAPNNKIPWLILLPKKGKDYCLLFNPEEKHKTYRIQDLSVDFTNSHCLTTCGSWLLMQDSRCNLYIMNLFTRERIDLPSVESQVGMIKIKRTIDDTFLVTNESVEYHRKHIKIVKPLFWIDEKTNDYVVIWLIEQGHLALFQSRKGEGFWKQIEFGLGTFDMVYKDHKLYLHSYSREIKVLDCSGDIPTKVFEKTINHKVIRPKRKQRRVYPEVRGGMWCLRKIYLVITVNGEILRVKSIKWSNSDWYFRIYKLDSSNSVWEEISCLGEEAILLDQGITVLANDIEGVNKNSIYFSGFHGFCEWSEKDIVNFNLDTYEVERPHENICSSIGLFDARWCLPKFSNKITN